jgi:hypothetical protein
VSELIRSDPLIGTRTEWYEDPVTEDITIATTRDDEAILDANVADFNTRERHSPHGELAMVARVPMPKLMELMRLGIAQDDKAFRKWLNDPDNRKFRVRPGRV